MAISNPSETVHQSELLKMVSIAQFDALDHTKWSLPPWKIGEMKLLSTWGIIEIEPNVPKDAYPPGFRFTIAGRTLWKYHTYLTLAEYVEEDPTWSMGWLHGLVLYRRFGLDVFKLADDNERESISKNVHELDITMSEDMPEAVQKAYLLCTKSHVCYQNLTIGAEI